LYLGLWGEAIEEFLKEERGGGFYWEFHEGGDDGFEGAIEEMKRVGMEVYQVNRDAIEATFS
jgi:hypothetical protein